MDPVSTAMEGIVIVAAAAEASPEEGSPASQPEGTSGGTYSFSVKRSCDPCMDDSRIRKKLSKSCAENQSADVYKATRLSRWSPSKPGSSRRHECRKGDKEPEIIGLQVETNQKVVMRSRIKHN